MAQFESNSYKSKKAAQKEQEPVEDVETPKTPVAGVKIKKRSGLKKAFAFLLSDDADSIKTFVVSEVLIPAVKKAISDIMSNGTDILLYGESRRPRGTTSGSSPISKISYNTAYNKPENRRPSEPLNRRYNYTDDIILETKGQAEEVLIRLDEILQVYKMVTVADLNDILGVTGSHTDFKYGWTNLSTADSIRTRDGYLLKLPRVSPLN